MRTQQIFRLPASARGVSLVLLAALAAACGGGEGTPGGSSDDTPAPAGASPTAAGLSDEELRLGIGPVRSLDLGDVDHELAEDGEDVFTVKCAACHKLEERYVGPPLGDVLERRTPEFVMNMILNPDEMVARHPEVKKLLAQYYTPMPDQQLTEDEARAVLEYLRAPSEDDSDEDHDDRED